MGSYFHCFNTSIILLYLVVFFTSTQLVLSASFTIVLVNKTSFSLSVVCLSAPLRVWFFSHHTFPVVHILCTIRLMRGRGPFHSSPKSGQPPRKWAFETRSRRSGYRRTGYIIHPVPFNRENMRWAWESNSRYAMVSCKRGTLPVCTDHIIHPVSFNCENMRWDLTKFPVHHGFSQARYFAY